MVTAASRIGRLLDRADRALESPGRWAASLFLTAFVLKLVYIVQSADALHVQVPVMDSKYYDETAQDIAAGNFMRREAFFMGPLYPYFLSLVYSIFGRDFMVVRIIQAMGGALSVALTFLVGREAFRPSVAFLGAVLFMLYGAATFYDGQLLMTWMGTLLNLLFLLLLMRAGREQNDRLRSFVAAGVVLGLSALARANVLVLAPVAVAWIVWGVRSRRRVAQSAVLIAATAVTLMPATIHNYRASKDLVPVTSNAGLNFFIGNNEMATGIFYPLPEIDFVRDPTSRSYIERLLGRDLSPSEVSDYWFGRSSRFIGAHPARAVRLLGRKAALFFNGYEIPQIEAFAIEERKYPSLRGLFVGFWFICSFGLLGMLFSIGDGHRRWLLTGSVVAYAASIVLFFVTSRYRVPAAALMCVFAAHAATVVAPRFLTSARRGAVFVGSLGLLLLLTNPSLMAFDEKEVTFRQYVHDSRRLGEVGRYDEALAAIDSAVALYPDFHEGYWHRAIIQKQKRDYFKAIEDFNRTLEIKPDLPTVHYDLAQTLRQLGMRNEAIGEYRAAIALDPVMVEAYNNLGITYREVKRYDDAIAAFNKVIELDPRYVKAYNNLGASLAEGGRVDEAIVVFERTTQMFPDYANTYRNLAMAYVSVRNPDRAIDAIDIYIRLVPDDQDARVMLEKLRIAAAADTL